MRISIGILAWNEAETIGNTIRAILQQDLLQHRCPQVESIEIVCVPNGCTDTTAETAREVLQFEAVQHSEVAFQWKVVELAEGGKPNAWNHLVHHVADQRSDLIIMMDADISFRSNHVLSALIQALEQTPRAVVAAATPVKDIALKRTKSLFEQLSVGVTQLQATAAYTFICGQLYCARGEFLRRVHMARGMIGEDAFLMGSTITNLCTTGHEFDRITHPLDAQIVFQAYTKIGTVLKQHRRRRVTGSVNRVLFDHIAAHRGNLDSGEFIRRENECDPDWFRKLLAEAQRSGKLKAPLWSPVRGRLWQLKRQGRLALYRWPFAFVAAAEEFVVALQANRAIRRGEITGLWQRRA